MLQKSVYLNHILLLISIVVSIRVCEVYLMNFLVFLVMYHENNSLYHRIFKMKSVDINSSTYIDFDKEKTEKGPKFELGSHVRISRYKKMQKIKLQTGLKTFLLSRKAKNTLPWTYVMRYPNGEEIYGTIYEKVLQKTI